MTQDRSVRGGVPREIKAERTRGFRVERITCNEEERLREGFEIETRYRFAPATGVRSSNRQRHGMAKGAINDPTFVGKEMFSTLASSSWENCVPLQAADLIAYENFNDSERHFTGRPRRKSFDFILEMESFGGRAKIFHAEGIRIFRQSVDNIRRDSQQSEPGSLY